MRWYTCSLDIVKFFMRNLRLIFVSSASLISAELLRMRISVKKYKLIDEFDKENDTDRRIYVLQFTFPLLRSNTNQRKFEAQIDRHLSRGYVYTETQT